MAKHLVEKQLAYLAKDKKGNWYLVLQEGAGEAHYEIVRGRRKVPTEKESRERRAITRTFEIFGIKN